jgi:CheY-like chemotaxis protein
MNEADHQGERRNSRSNELLARPFSQEHLWAESKHDSADEFVQSLLHDRATSRRTRAASDAHVLLVVEDDPDDFMLLDRALRKTSGYAVVGWARSVTEALNMLDQLETHAQTICLVADLKLPGLDGFELLQRIKHRSSPIRLRFVFLTGRPDPTTELRARASGADAFFVKPASSEEWMNIARVLQDLAV